MSFLYSSGKEILETFPEKNLDDYSGDTGQFGVEDTTGTQWEQHRKYVVNSTYGTNPPGKIYRTDKIVKQGESFSTIAVGASSTSRGNFAEYLFGVQDGSNYYKCMWDVGETTTSNNGRLEIIKIENGNRTVLNRNTEVSNSSLYKFYKLQTVWKSDGTITLRLIDDRNIIDSVSATDTTFSSGGIGWRPGQGYDMDYYTKFK